jgi:hypothetical protein
VLGDLGEDGGEDQPGKTRTRSSVWKQSVDFCGSEGDPSTKITRHGAVRRRETAQTVHLGFTSRRSVV